MSLNATIKTGMELERIVEDTCHKYRAEGPSATARPCDLSLLYTTNKAQFPTVMYIPGLDALPVWGMYSIEQILEKHSSEISKEYKSRQAEAKKGKIEKDVQSSNAWEVINLMAEGSWIEENVHLFPRTVGIVRQLPLMETGLGYVYFSVLTMKTNIRGHCGVTNAKLRIQLPVVLETAADGSSQGSYISIAGENHQYELHKPIIFDDSYTHAVTNYHTERAVLIIDIWHPSLSLASRGLITSTFPPATPKALQAKPYAVIPHRQTPIFTSPAPALTRFTSPEFDCILKLLLVGDQGAGKSSLLMRYSEDAFTDKFIATIGVDFKINNIVYPDAAAQKDVKIRMQVWDIAGPERFRTITSAYYRGAHGLLLCFAIADRESFTSASLMWVKEINKYNPLATVLLIGLKGDLSKQREVSVEEGEQAAQRIGALYCECSSKTGEGVDHVFATMVHSIMSDESAKASIINDSLARNKQRNKHVSPTGKPDIRNKCVIS